MTRSVDSPGGRGAFVPLAFMPGEAFQFDWSEDWAIIGGERTKLQVAHFKLSYSRAFILRAYPQQTHEMLFDAHNHAFRVLGGVPRRGIYDNMRTAVDKVGRGKERQVNARFSAMVSHFLFEAEFCNPASGWEKGQNAKSGLCFPSYETIAERPTAPARPSQRPSGPSRTRGSSHGSRGSSGCGSAAPICWATTDGAGVCCGHQTPTRSPMLARERLAQGLEREPPGAIVSARSLTTSCGSGANSIRQNEPGG